MDDWTADFSINASNVFRFRNNDKKMDFSEKKTIAGFEPRFIAYADESCMFGERTFWIASVLGLTWPYRFLMWRNTGTPFCKVRKNIFVSHVTNNNVHVRRITDNPSTCIDVESDAFVAISIDHKDCAPILSEGLKNVLHHFKIF